MPDVVIAADGEPVVSIEQTQMNPSGHNIPQRFSFQVRAAEVGVPSILYYPEFSRRTFSDPNVRYLQLRVPLAQKRLSAIYDIPALSVFWPTDEATKLPDTRQCAHKDIANVVRAIVDNAGKKTMLRQIDEVVKTSENMDRIVSKYSRQRRSRYRPNPSVRTFFPNGFPTSLTPTGHAIDPPMTCQLQQTEEFLDSISSASSDWRSTKVAMTKRKLTLVFTGTANKSKTDSEHPWPGYLTLLDILYLRTDFGRSPSQRIANLVYRLPVKLSTFLFRVNTVPPPTAAYIVDTFADLIILEGGVVPGRPVRGRTGATPI